MMTKNALKLKIKKLDNHDFVKNCLDQDFFKNCFDNSKK